MLTTTKKTSATPHDCPIEECLRFLAGAWTPKIIWYLQAGPRRFGDLKRDLGTISAKVLTTRLREMETRGLVSRTVMPTSPPTVEYAMTEFGLTFMPALKAILAVGMELRKRSDAGTVIDDSDCVTFKEEVKPQVERSELPRSTTAEI